MGTWCRSCFFIAVWATLLASGLSGCGGKFSFDALSSAGGGSLTTDTSGPGGSVPGPDYPTIMAICQSEQTRLFGGSPPSTTIDQSAIPEITGNENLLVVTDSVTRISDYRGNAVIRRKTPSNGSGLITRITGNSSGNLIVCGLSVGTVESDMNLVIVGGSAGSISGDGNIKIYGNGTISSHTGKGSVERIPL